ncbi:hypothetical protein ACQYWY_20310 [Comamonas sediminis]|uniref:hypothetical protein n=1 Tax=Comamonas sediminis TaxID=1783360 RepID=UPI003D29900E
MKYLQWLSLVCGLVGFALLIAGLALYSVPVALVVAGVLLMAYAWRIDKAVAASQRLAPNETKG